jgi:lysyl-tRNA synthetase class II
MGGSSFVKIQDRSGQIQLLVRRDRVGEALYAEFKKWDVGDIVGASGELIKTKTGELSIDVASLRLIDSSPVDRRRELAAAREVAASAAREVARNRGRGIQAPPALRRSDHERGSARGVPQA